jgi:hypothetical protein
MSIEQKRTLTGDECDKIAEALRQDAATLSDDLEKENLLELAECYRDLAQVKHLALGKVN